MCGIVGCFAQKGCYEKLYSALTRLEYRGYDSAGIATLSEGGAFSVRKKRGGVAAIAGAPLIGCAGIGHTRWATHGVPSDVNAHPHLCGKFALVHNGVVENDAALRAELSAQGERFLSQTDSELIVHLIARAYAGDFFAAVSAACARIEGSYAVAVLCADHPDTIVCARRGCPLVAGAGGGALYVCSDIPALCGSAAYICPAEEGEFVVIRAGEIDFFRADGTPVPGKVFARVRGAARPRAVGAKTRMEAEIAEVPAALAGTLASLQEADLSACRAPFRAARRVLSVGCGTAYHAALSFCGLLASQGVPALCRPASEAADLAAGEGELLVAVSQSGETADTLAAARAARARGAFLLAVTNVEQSSLAALADAALFLRAGPEVAVAATKSYNCQLLCLYFVAARLLASRGAPQVWEQSLAALPALARRAFGSFSAVEQLAAAWQGARGMYFLGRGQDAVTAREGALKVKEIAYIFAEGLPAGELKHGPLALVEKGFPVALICTSRALVRKCAAAAAEVAARGGQVALFSQYAEALAIPAAFHIRLPAAPEPLMPALAVIPLQHLACRLALLRGHDPDRPRNLAKSVTVE